MVDGEGPGWHREPRRHADAASKGWRDRARRARQKIAEKTKFLKDPEATQKITEAITIGSVVAGTIGDISRIRGRKQSDPVSKTVHESPLLTMAYNPKTHQLQNPFLKQIAYVQKPGGEYVYFYNVASPEDALYQAQMRGDIPVGLEVFFKGSKDIVRSVGKKVSWDEFVERLGKKGEFERLAEMALVKSEATLAQEEKRQERDVTGLLARYVWKKQGEQLSLGNLAKLEDISKEKDESTGEYVLPLVLDPIDQARLDTARSRLRELERKSYSRTTAEVTEMEQLRRELEPTADINIEALKEKISGKKTLPRATATSKTPSSSSAVATSKEVVYATSPKSKPKSGVKDVSATLEYLGSVEHAKTLAAREESPEVMRREFTNEAGRPNDRAFSLATRLLREEQGYTTYEEATAYIESIAKFDPDEVVDMALRAKGLGYVG